MSTEQVRRVPPAGLGPMLRAARARAGLGLREAARRIGISHTYLRDLEASRRAPSVSVVDDLLQTLDLTDEESAALTAMAIMDRGRSHPLRKSANWDS